mgnify:CR=1 FL=1
MWKSHSKELDNMSEETIKYPSGDNAPTDKKIEELKQKISKLLPT